MYFYLQTSELLSGKAFNIMPDILHFDVRNVRYKIPIIMRYNVWAFLFFLFPTPLLLYSLL